MINLIGVFKDEEKYIQEWILYHYIIGIKNFSLCCHQCSDNTAQLIKNISNILKDISIDLIINDQTNNSGWKFKNDIYSNLVSLSKKDWCLCLDIDEFLVIDWKHLQEIISDSNIGAIAIYQNIFGCSNHISSPRGLVIDNYIYRNNDKILINNNYPIFNHPSDLFKEVKMLFNKEGLKKIVNSHEVIIDQNTVNENLDLFKRYKVQRTTDHIKINHYFTKSLEDWTFKTSRPRMSAANKYDSSWFDYFSSMEYIDSFLSKEYSNRIKYYQNTV